MPLSVIVPIALLLIMVIAAFWRRRPLVNETSIDADEETS
jgi:hypothetical protein